MRTQFDIRSVPQPCDAGVQVYAFDLRVPIDSIQPSADLQRAIAAAAPSVQEAFRQVTSRATHWVPR
jgi:hypothetical protein